MRLGIWDMGLGEAVDNAIPKSHIPSPKSFFLEIITPGLKIQL